MITKYEKHCVICGSPAVNVHHSIFGRGMRTLASKYDLTMPMCYECHEHLHRGKETKLTQAMSRIIGQLYFEEQMCAEGKSMEDAREIFRAIFKESFL